MQTIFLEQKRVIVSVDATIGIIQLIFQQRLWIRDN